VTVTCRRAQAVNPTIVMSLGNTFGYTAIRQAVDLQACRPKRATFWSGRGCVAWRPKPRWTSAFTHHFLPRCDLLIIDKARYSTPPRSLIMPLTWVNIDLVRSEGLEPPAFWSVGPPWPVHDLADPCVSAGQRITGRAQVSREFHCFGLCGSTFGSKFATLRRLVWGFQFPSTRGSRAESFSVDSEGRSTTASDRDAPVVPTGRCRADVAVRLTGATHLWVTSLATELYDLDPSALGREDIEYEFEIYA
jgi:hypothetical protein